MMQFTFEQAAALRKRADAGEIRHFLRHTIENIKGNFLIPPNKAATWGGFYACPKHSARLEFNFASPHAHKCPVDDEMITGEIYDGSWWRNVNELNQEACHHAALLYLLDEDKEAFELAKRYLIEYAKVYPSYEVHGGIPYNNPGKANAQTLCDAGWIKGLLFAYDIIRAEMLPEEQTLIDNDLFRCCGEFLMEYRSSQIHNHEVVVDSAIAMIGLFLDDKNMLDFGLNNKYGIKYQLKHGLLADGLWFEGTPGYHFYMFQQVMYFEMLALHTEYSIIKDPGIIKALCFPLKFLQPDGTLPPLNDAGMGYSGFDGAENIYELAYLLTKDEEILSILQCIYKNRKRTNIFSFFHGVEHLPKHEFPLAKEYHAGAQGSSGITTMLGADERFLLIKHSPFGGEHDHYDRLAIHFLGFGAMPIPDLGTSLYGAPLHYNYYKNTATHNTVCIDGKNQPPANCKVYCYEKQKEYTLLDSGVEWDGKFKPMNTLVIPQWSNEAYNGAKFRRLIVWYDTYFIDVFRVDLPEKRTIDYTLHVRGERTQSPETQAYTLPWATEGAGSYFHDISKVNSEDMPFSTHWNTGKKSNLEILSFMQKGSECYYLSGPDNPSSTDLSYMVQRVEGQTALFANIVSLYEPTLPVIKNATIEVNTEGRLEIKVEKTDGIFNEFSYSFKE